MERVLVPSVMIYLALVLIHLAAPAPLSTTNQVHIKHSKIFDLEIRVCLNVINKGY